MNNMYFITYELDHPVVELECSSFGLYYTACAAGGIVHDINVKNQLSSSPCIENESFGFSGTDVWANKGCRAIFTIKILGMLAFEYFIYQYINNASSDSIC